MALFSIQSPKKWKVNFMEPTSCLFTSLCWIISRCSFLLINLFWPCNCLLTNAMFYSFVTLFLYISECSCLLIRSDSLLMTLHLFEWYWEEPTIVDWPFITKSKGCFSRNVITHFGWYRDCSNGSKGMLKCIPALIFYL